MTSMRTASPRAMLPQHRASMPRGLRPSQRSSAPCTQRGLRLQWSTSLSQKKRMKQRMERMATLPSIGSAG
eukprot:11199451-Prorocentrum_lima.AAC.1